ncbi:velvet factor, partial [Protomyces lactucae-debilis]
QTTSGKQYSFTVRQQPVHARMCGFGEKDRRPIDPPPILECVCLNYPSEQADQGSQPRPTRVKDPYLSVHVMLLDETGREECGLILSSSSRKQSERHGQPSSPEAGRTSPPAHRTASTQKVTRVLMGSLVTNSIQLEDDQGVEGSFFIFPDLSVRTEGRYTLKFTLFSLEGLSLAAASGTRANCIAEAVSEPFTVYTAKKFPGMLRSTELTKAFARQGYKVQVRND